MRYNDNMKKQRAIYIGSKPFLIKVWNTGRKKSSINFGTTGDYIGETFFPDDKDIQAFNLNADYFKFELV